MTLLKKGIGIVGSTTIDKIIAADHRFLKLGGVTTYAGITYRRHGIPVFIISNIAEQDLEVMAKLRAEDILVFSAKSDLSTYFVNYSRGDIRYQELLQQAGSIKNKKVYRSVSVQMTAGLTLARIVKANEAEYHAILAFYQMTLAELMHCFKIEEFVVTLGDKGGFVQKQNGETFHYDAALVKTPVDSTGAGDVFLAAYVVSRFVDKIDIPDACMYAAKIAARQVEGKYITKDALALSENHEKL